MLEPALGVLRRPTLESWTESWRNRYRNLSPTLHRVFPDAFEMPTFQDQYSQASRDAPFGFTIVRTPRQSGIKMGQIEGMAKANRCRGVNFLGGEVQRFLRRGLFVAVRSLVSNQSLRPSRWSHPSLSPPAYLCSVVLSRFFDVGLCRKQAPTHIPGRILQEVLAPRAGSRHRHFRPPCFLFELMLSNSHSLAHSEYF